MRKRKKGNATFLPLQYIKWLTINCTRRYWESWEGTRYICWWYKMNEENRCSSNLKILPYHIAPPCVNPCRRLAATSSTSPHSNLNLGIFNLQPAPGHPREPLTHDGFTCTETRQKNAIPAPAVVPPRTIFLFSRNVRCQEPSAAPEIFPALLRGCSGVARDAGAGSGRERGWAPGMNRKRKRRRW